jgi:hypothetical protein
LFWVNSVYVKFLQHNVKINCSSTLFKKLSDCMLKIKNSISYHMVNVNENVNDFKKRLKQTIRQLHNTSNTFSYCRFDVNVLLWCM